MISAGNPRPLKKPAFGIAPIASLPNRETYHTTFRSHKCPRNTTRPAARVWAAIIFSSVESRVVLLTETHVPTTDRSRLRKIASSSNATVQGLRKAFSRGEPTEDGFIAIESVRVIEEAIRSGL